MCRIIWIEKYEYLNNFFRKWTDLDCHTHMQKEGLPKYQASPSLFPSVIATTCPMSLHAHSTEHFSWLHWVLPPASCWSLQYRLLSFTVRHGVFLHTYHFPTLKKLHILPGVTANTLLVLSKPIYTGISNIVTKEQWLNWKRNGLNTIVNFCVGSRCL